MFGFYLDQPLCKTLLTLLNIANNTARVIGHFSIEQGPCNPIVQMPRTYRASMVGQLCCGFTDLPELVGG